MDSFPRLLGTRGLLLVAALLLGLAGCARDHRQTAEDTLREIGPAVVRQEAAIFYKQLFVAPTGHYFLPKLEQCPPTFQRLRPRRVRAYEDGFALAAADVRGAEEGIYIVPLGMDAPPRASSSATFQRIDEGIYWYAFAE